MIVAGIQLMEAKFNNGAVPLINDLLEKAADLEASDLHIEPNGNNLRVRYRVDGLLQSGINIHKSMQQQVISRIKIMSDLDISEQRLPQDGRTFIKIGNREFDLRISIIPTFHGEKSVIRRARDAGRRPQLLQSSDRKVPGIDHCLRADRVRQDHYIIFLA
jgi:type II secretory ATPase GspE/PulE/Tfp pilus assembly ATPase PilB-like protein